MFNTISQLALYFIDNMSLLLLAFAIYRLPIKYNIVRLITSGAILTAVSYIQRDILDYTEFYILVNVLVGVILIMFLFELPVAYSLLIIATGYIVLIAIQMVNIVVPLITGLLTMEQVQSKIMIIPSAIIIAIILIVIHRKKLGFMLIANRFSLKRGSVKPRDFFVAGIFVSLVVLAQTSMVAFYENAPLIYFLVGMIILMLIGLGITYFINIKEIEERYFRRKPK